MNTKYMKTTAAEFASDHWIVGLDARVAVVHGDVRGGDAWRLVGSRVKVDGCDYRCVAVSRDASERHVSSGPRLRLFIESL